MDLPIDEIGTVVGLGGTFHSHLDEVQRTYRWPDLWVVPDTAIIPPDEPIRIPQRAEKIKPGAEITAVIGEPIADADEAAAWKAIEGFTVSNDVTASGDWPGWSDPDHPTITGIGYKILPTFWPVLTDYVPKREVDTYDDLHVEVRVDGEVAVDGSTKQLAFTIPEMVSYASQVVPLEPNDLVALGDPGNPKIYLDDAESVTCSIETIGDLTNPIERE